MCSSLTTKLVFKNSNLLLQKRIRDSKYIPPKYICKKVYNCEILKKEEANFFYQHYKGEEKLGKFIITKKIKERNAAKIPEKNDFQDKDMTTTQKTRNIWIH